MNKKEIQERLTAIAEELSQISTSLDEGSEEQDKSIDELEGRVKNLMDEKRDLESRLNEIVKKEKRDQVVSEIKKGTAKVSVIERGGKVDEKKIYGADSKEYRNAWLKEIARDYHGERMFGDPNEEEKRAFIFTTEAVGQVVPTDLQNKILDRVKAEAPMLEDATKTALSNGFAIPVRTAIAEGDAAVVAQDAANADEKDTFDLINLSGVDIKKHVIMTRRMKFQSIDAFESWLVADLSKRIMVAKEKVLLARLDGTTPGAGTAAPKVAIAAANVLTGKAYDDATIRNIMALIDEPGQVVVYANRKTIFNGLTGIKDGDGQKAYIDNPQVDPTTAGVLYGAVVKVDSNLADNVAYFGVRGSLMANSFAPLEVFPTTEAKTANIIYTGTEIFDGGLTNPTAFVKVTFAGE